MLLPLHIWIISSKTVDGIYTNLDRKGAGFVSSLYIQEAAVAKNRLYWLSEIKLYLYLETKKLYYHK